MAAIGSNINAIESANEEKKWYLGSSKTKVNSTINKKNEVAVALMLDPIKINIRIYATATRGIIFLKKNKKSNRE
jgi:hypothetical protein